MSLSPGARRVTLTAHVASSVGWLGAVAGFLALSIVALTTGDADLVRSSYLAMNVLGEFLIVPLSLAALVTGLMQSLGTHWGLVRHYWVLTKFALTMVATSLLLLHQFTAVAEAARVAAGTAIGALPEVDGLGKQLLFDSGAAVFVLLVTTTLSIYKPWGRTGFEQREIAANFDSAQPVRSPLGFRLFAAIVGLIVATIVVVHLAGGGMGRH